MASRWLDVTDAARSQLGAAMAAVERQMTVLAGPAAHDSGHKLEELRAAWDDLVDLVCLEGVPQVRECPVCRRTDTKARSHCGFCWTELESVPGRF